MFVFGGRHVWVQEWLGKKRRVAKDVGKGLGTAFFSQ
jgi:hypothetical protein